MTQSVSFLTSPALQDPARLRHGFFTRQGGVSKGIYGSLNTGYGSDDDAAAVTENRRRIAEALALPALNTVYQVHGRDVAHVAGPWQPADAPKCDAMVTDRPGIALGILTADCAPVLFADAEAGVVGAAHAGWKGAVTGVLQATIAAMEGLGARRDAIAAAVGPTIARESYEVGPEFPAPFLAGDPDNARFFSASPRAGHFMFDLPGFIESVLAGQGLGAVDILAADTCADPERFFSYRRATHRGEPDYGRGLSAIALNP
ncbi:MAG: peptidoglycan editing factor PgeF [Proteobacteria bacterium]|nr:peptidoglycan editing factor PgeF [Pseudomonadota bacterium]